MAASIIINIPMNIQRTITKKTFNFTIPGSSMNISETFITYGGDGFPQLGLVVLMFSCLFIRDVLVFICEVKNIFI